MKKLISLLLSCLPLLYSCVHNESLQERFNILKDIDYSEFSDMSIVNRKGVYYVTYQGTAYKIKRNFITQKISSIERDLSKDKVVLLTKKKTVYIEHALKSFDKIKVLALSIDEKGDVFLALPWYEGCTYYFLRLSPSSSLKDFKEQQYKVYEGNWYMDKECSER